MSSFVFEKFIMNIQVNIILIVPNLRTSFLGIIKVIPMGSIDDDD